MDRAAHYTVHVYVGVHLQNPLLFIPAIFQTEQRIPSAPF